MDNKKFREALALCRGLLDRLESEPQIKYADLLLTKALIIGDLLHNSCLQNEEFVPEISRALRGRIASKELEERFDELIETTEQAEWYASLPELAKKKFRADAINDEWWDLTCVADKHDDGIRSLIEMWYEDDKEYYEAFEKANKENVENEDEDEDKRALL